MFCLYKLYDNQYDFFVEVTHRANIENTMPQTPREQLATTMRRIYNANLTTLSGGNLSMKTQDGIWITPSGIDKGELTAEDIVRIKTNGDFEGKHRPSSEYPFHLAIYDVRPDVQAIIHTHSPSLVTYCVAHKIPDTQITPQTFAICGAIGYTPYVMPGSDKLGAALAETFSQGHQVVLMENHGVITVGTSLQEAFLRLDTASLVADISLKAHRLGEVLTTEHVIEETIAGKDNHTPTLSKKIVAFAKRAVQRQMMSRAIGYVSARVDSGFLITPPDGDREFFSPEDVILVNEQRGNNMISLFAAIYKKHPQVEAMMFSQPPYATAFAVTHQTLDTRSIPEAYLTLLDIPTMPFEIDAICDAISERSPVVIIENCGVLVTGKTLLHTFDRLEVLEYAARSAIEAPITGGVQALTDEAIRALEEVYHRYYGGLSG